MDARSQIYNVLDPSAHILKKGHKNVASLAYPDPNVKIQNHYVVST